MPSTKKRGILALEDGTIYHGYVFGAEKTTVGELVFNTSMVGYQEILTDPSYYAQIMTFTAPHIGNYGVNPADAESDGVKAFGVVVKALSPVASNYLSAQSLSDYLQEQGVPGVEGIDTRALTLKLRSEGVMKACLSTENISEEEAIGRAQSWEGMDSLDCVTPVTCKTPYEVFAYSDECRPFTIPGTLLGSEWPMGKRPEIHVVAFDFGAKRSIFKQLARFGFRVTVVPARTPVEEVKQLNPQAIFLSNGPGDPKVLTWAHEIVRQLMELYPMFGICLGHQVIAHAWGASTFKLKFGHRGGNHPVKNLEQGQVAITAQNHGYAVSAEEIERVGGVVTEMNLNDNTVSGMRHKTLPVFSVQYHPEAAPGPNDATHHFNHFYEMVSGVTVA